MSILGKGFFIWNLTRTENANPQAIALLAQQAGFSHVLIKIADGANPFNVTLDTGIDLVAPVAQALRGRGIETWGWHYVYGYEPVAEADIAIRRVRELNLDGYVIDAEGPYKEPGKDDAARIFMNRLRASLPDYPIALSSYRYPSLHPQIPWKIFLEKCDLNMPQVYWLQSHNPGEQLLRSYAEFQAITPVRPYIPTGAAFTERGWEPTVADVLEFTNTARSMNLNAVNFYEWANCRLYLPAVWNAIAAYPWPADIPTDVAVQYINALNSHDPAQVAALYTPNAVHVTPARTIQGQTAIQAWYSALLNQLLPNGVFTLTGYSGAAATRHFTWTARSGGGQVLNGNDTLALREGKIAYHYSFFTVA